MGTNGEKTLDYSADKLYIFKSLGIQQLIFLIEASSRQSELRVKGFMVPQRPGPRPGSATNQHPLWPEALVVYREGSCSFSVSPDGSHINGYCCNYGGETQKQPAEGPRSRTAEKHTFHIIIIIVLW